MKTFFKHFLTGFIYAFSLPILIYIGFDLAFDEGEFVATSSDILCSELISTAMGELSSYGAREGISLGNFNEGMIFDEEGCGIFLNEEILNDDMSDQEVTFKLPLKSADLLQNIEFSQTIKLPFVYDGTVGDLLMSIFMIIAYVHVLGVAICLLLLLLLYRKSFYDFLHTLAVILVVDGLLVVVSAISFNSIQFLADYQTFLDAFKYTFIIGSAMVLIGLATLIYQFYQKHEG